MEERYEYDTNGQVKEKTTTVAGTTITQSWTYDDQGRVSSETFPSCTGGLCSGLSAPSRTVARTYVEGDLSELKLNGQTLIAHDYHPNGMVSEVEHWRGAAPNALRWTDSIATGLYGVAHVKAIDIESATGTALPRVEYTYDVRGNLEQVGTDVYSYDRFDRLGSVQYQGGSQHFYSFDEFDNLTSLQAAFDGQQQDTMTMQVDASSNRILQTTGYNPAAVDYDRRGQMTQYGDQFYFYDEFGQVRGHRRGMSHATFDYEALYLYTADDQRVFHVEHYDAAPPAPSACGVGKAPETLTDASFSMVMLRGADGRVVREFRSLEYADGQTTGECPSYRDYFWAGLQQRAYDDGSGIVQHIHLDHLGNPRVLTTGFNIDSIQHFAPWGQEIGNPIDMRIGFTGHEKDRNGEGSSTTEDALTESYNFGARSYLPDLGRFSTPDPARDPSSWSLYGYAGGSPMMFVDPDGEWVVPVLAAGAGGLLNVGLTKLAYSMNGVKPDEGELGRAFVAGAATTLVAMGVSATGAGVITVGAVGGFTGGALQEGFVEGNDDPTEVLVSGVQGATVGILTAGAASGLSGQAPERVGDFIVDVAVSTTASTTGMIVDALGTVGDPDNVQPILPLDDELLDALEEY